MQKLVLCEGEVNNDLLECAPLNALASDGERSSVCNIHVVVKQ